MQIDLIKAYKRWRHSRGYGVHSPFAYSFVCETIKEDWPYYAYDRLDAVTRDMRPEVSLSPRRVRLLFRIFARFNPKRVMIAGATTNAAIEAECLSMACPSAKITDNMAEVDIIVVNSDFRIQSLQKDKNRNFAAVFMGKEAYRSQARRILREGVEHGISFDNGRDMSVIVADRRLSRQTVDVNF